MTVRLPINGDTLRWAREAVYVSPEELARAIGNESGKILAFEDGEAEPTLKQLEKIAHKLGRNLAFFLVPPPDGALPETVDFRDRGSTPINSILGKEMLRARQHRDTVLNLDGRPRPPAVVGRISLRNVRERAAELREKLNLSPDFVPGDSDASKVFRFWRGILERNGYLVFQTGAVKIDIFRGLSMNYEDLPVILVNGADATFAKVFTLFHEVAHLSNHTGGLCLVEETGEQEVIANTFASNFLMPMERTKEVLWNIESKADTPQTLATLLAKEFRVSWLAAATRLREMGLITQSDWNGIRIVSKQNYDDSRKRIKESEGGPQRYRVSLSRLGMSYVGSIAEALKDGRISMLDASYYTGEKIPTVEKMIDEYNRVGVR